MSNALQQVTALVYQFGPFAFAIVFVFLVSRQCNSQYLAAVARTTNPATPAELRMYRWFFYLSFVIGCGLSIYSVYWWQNAQQKYFVFDFRITGVAADKKLVGVYPVIPKTHALEQDDGTLLYEFIVIKEGPFKPDQKFTVSVMDNSAGAAGGTGPGRSDVDLVWGGHPSQQFRVVVKGNGYALQSE